MKPWLTKHIEKRETGREKGRPIPMLFVKLVLNSLEFLENSVNFVLKSVHCNIEFLTLIAY